METKQCEFRVSHDDWGHTHQCTKTAKVEREGKFYCKIHDPEYVKAKEEASYAKFEAEWAKKKAYMELQNTAVSACKAINPTNPLAVAKEIGNMVEVLQDIFDNKNDTQLYTALSGQQWIEIENVLDNIKREE